MANPAATKLPPPFDASRFKPVHEMSYPDRVAVWKEYCVFRKLSNDFKVYSDRNSFAFVESQILAIKEQYLDHFNSTDLIDPKYL